MPAFYLTLEAEGGILCINNILFALFINFKAIRSKLVISTSSRCRSYAGNIYMWSLILFLTKTSLMNFEDEAIKTVRDELDPNFPDSKKWQLDMEINMSDSQLLFLQ